MLRAITRHYGHSLLQNRSCRKSNLKHPAFYSLRSFCSISNSSGNNDDSDGDGKGSQSNVVEIVQTGQQGKAVTPTGGDHIPPTFPHVVVVPTTRRPVFPGVALPLSIQNSELSKALIALKDSGQPYCGLFLKKKDSVNKSDELITDLSELHNVGTFARIDNIVRFDSSTIQVLLFAHRRIRIDGLHDVGPPLRAKVSTLQNESYEPNSDMIKAYSNQIVATLREVVKLNPLFKEHMQYFSERIDIHNPYKLADFAASVTTAESEDLQAVMGELNCARRLKLTLELITKELDISRVQQSIKEQVEEKVSKQQRRYLLLEHLKTIKQELGMEKDDKEALVAKYREKVANAADMSKEAREAVDEELNKLEMLEKNSSEFNVTRNYLDWLTHMPWGKSTKENFDILNARRILDEDHYGLDDIKERILEFIAVSKLKNSVQGKIICFVGPPGTGKTSIVKSVARALNREFYRFSVGGLSDVAEIKGHRRTYVAAMPGKIVQCLKTTQSSNPVILIDEIDKLGRGGNQGDPASALLELLDPSQNGSFVDHYMDVPLDLSKALFVCTANITDTIPGPLQDRMEILRLSGYDAPEKVAIARQYLVPKALESSGLSKSLERTPKDLEITDKAINSVIRKYCREAGVRNLQHHIEKILRKVALKVVKAESDGLESNAEPQPKSYVVDEQNLEEFIGKPVFTTDRMYDKIPPGVVMGLAWTSMGGTSLYIETTKTNKTGSATSSLTTTGQMGSVMEESTKIAHTYARHHLFSIEPENDFFTTSDIHMHIPEGATKKDGPSAGCTMVTALLSLAMDRCVPDDLAMTGELSLVGKILPVGGIKEKTIAARRANVRTLILPLGNKRDFEELPDYLKDGLDVHYADYYQDIFSVVFGS